MKPIKPGTKKHNILMARTQDAIDHAVRETLAVTNPPTLFGGLYYKALRREVSYRGTRLIVTVERFEKEAVERRGEA